jgi:hypothetical protein
LLTTAQKTTLNTHISTNPDLSSFPNVRDHDQTIADYMNAVANPAVFGWNNAVPVESILNALNYANFTPNESPAQANEVNGQTWENRAMLVQIKQMNLQVLLQGRSTLDATRGNLRTGLQDATENLPTGNNGALRTGGWANIQPVLSRAALRIEALLRTGGGAGTQADPYTFDYQGQITADDVFRARNP